MAFGRSIFVGQLLKVTFLGFVSGLMGTGIGGLMVFLFRKLSNKYLSFLLEFSAGLMMSVVCFELVPESLETGGKVYAFTGIFSGIFAIIAIEAILKKADWIKRAGGDKSLLRTGIMTAIGIALHNFPEGVAVGSGFEASVSLGLTITAVIIIHDIPEGMSMALPMKAGGFSGTRAFLLTLLSGTPMGFGAFLGSLLGGISPEFISMCLGFAAGAMLYIVCAELVPESKKLYLGRFSSLGNVLGIICGIIITILN